MFIIILYIPLINFLLLLIFGNLIGYKGCKYLTFLLLILLLLVLFLLFFYYLIGYYTVLIDMNLNLINFNYLIISWIFIFDSLGIIMLFLVSIISLLVHIYSFNYMEMDPHIIRFISLLSLFTFFMFLLIMSSNFIIFFFGWEGVGLCSYLLVNFWFTRIEANKAALKAMLVNRVGDISLLIFISISYYICKSIDFAIIFSLINEIYKGLIIINGLKINLILIFGILLIISAVGKSAQLGLHTWLPDAMEGPTPVSALIHAATMVTAGIFLLIRMSYLLEYNDIILKILVIIGGLTIIFTGLIACFQNDIKKIIAYSTCSQLGYMVVACGLSQYNLAIFHLFNHGFFKALLFLGAGIIIHILNNEQDMRKMGKLIYYIPFVYKCFFIGTVALIGLPFLSGYYSKEIIINMIISNSYNKINFIFYILILISIGLTTIYSIRLINLIFFDSLKGDKIIYKKIHDLKSNFLIVLLILVIFSLFCGYIFFDLFVGFGVNYFTNTIFKLPSIYINDFDYEFQILYIKLLPIIIIIIILYIYKEVIYDNKLKKKIYKSKIKYFFINRCYFDLLYNTIFIKLILKNADKIMYKFFDKNLLEILGVFGSFYIIRNVIIYFIYIFNSIFSNLIICLIFAFFFILNLQLIEFIIYNIIVYYYFLIKINENVE